MSRPVAATATCGRHNRHVGVAVAADLNSRHTATVSADHSTDLEKEN